jgi:hypothetical protein
MPITIDYTQPELDALEKEALTMVDAKHLDTLNADIAAKRAYPNVLGRFLQRLINELESGDLAKYRPEPPKVEEKNEHGNRKPGSDNPWSAAAWNVSEQGRLTRRLGEEKAAQIAKAAGCKLGSLRPNPHFN